MKSEPIEACFRYCPRCATESHEVGAVPFRCEACGYAQFFGPVGAVGALVTNDQNQLLLVRRANNPGKGLWGLPGGFVDRDETIEEALAREVLEETNLRVVWSEYLFSYPNRYDYSGAVAPVIDFFFSCKVDPSDEISLAADELSHHEWVRPTDAYLDHMAFHSNRLAIERWMSNE